MKHIPIEVLREIFTNLDLQDKLACMLVCRFWYNTLDRFTLLYNISVKNTQFPKFKDMMDRFPYRATQVECLTLSRRFEPNIDKRELFNMFPNLRQLNFSMYTDERPQNRTFKPVQFLYTTSKLEKMEDFGDCESVPQLAMSNLCNNLKTLKLDFDDLNVSETHNIILQLKNMPVLQELWMRCMTFKLMDLEVMHNNLPSIKSMVFDDSELIAGEIPQNITPASSIVQLEMQIWDIDERHILIQLYKYIGNKYPSVYELNVDGFRITDLNDEDSIHQVYNEGIFPLYQKIGSQVDTITLRYYCEELDAFRKLDDYGMKLKEVFIENTLQFDDILFIEELVQSQQSKYIQKLVLQDIIPDPISMLNNMVVLETLIIHGSYIFGGYENVLRDEINFTQLINACPATLTTLKICNLHFKYDGPTSNTTCIKYLEILNVELLPDLAGIIETSFPQLSTLRLHTEITGDVAIVLLDHKLKEVDIKGMYYEDGESTEYSMESLCYRGLQFHTIKRKPNRNDDDDDQLYASDSGSNPEAEKELGPSFALYFICSSIEQLSFSTERNCKC